MAKKSKNTNKSKGASAGKSKSTGSSFGGLKIPMNDWRKMHPFGGKPYICDMYYLRIANRILPILIEERLVPVYTVEDMQYVALCLTAYFEDVVSELCIFRAFIKEYRRLYDRQFPWYEIKEEYLDDEVNLVDVQYVMWQSMFARRESSIPNPENADLLSASRRVYDLMLEEFEKAPVNKDLVNDIYDKELERDVAKLKTLLMWIGSHCYLFPLMAPARRQLEPTFEALHDFFLPPGYSQQMVEYMDESYRAFATTCGPLALYPKNWYHLMCLQKNFRNNFLVYEMEHTPVYPFAILSDTGDNFLVCSCRGREYLVSKSSFAEPEVNNLTVGDIVVGMLFRLGNSWNLCGLALNSYIHDLKAAFEKLEETAQQLVDGIGRKVDMVGVVDTSLEDNSYYGMEYDSLKCAQAITFNDFDRLFYFKNLDEAQKWNHKNLIGKRRRKKDEQTPEWDEPVALYITDDNRVLISSAAPEIEDPKNTYYDPGDDNSILSLLFDQNLLPNPLCKYIILKQYFSRYALQSVYGREHGRKLIQDNMRFFMTMIRQYPF